MAKGIRSSINEYYTYMVINTLYSGAPFVKLCSHERAGKGISLLVPEIAVSRPRGNGGHLEVA